MALLGTSVSDPNYYQNQGARLGNAVGGLLESLDRRRQEREEEELKEIETFFRMAQVAPEVADTWGTDIKKKFGSKHAGVGHLVDALQQRHQVAAAAQAEQTRAKDAWLQNWNNLNSGYSQAVNEVGALPDVAPVPGSAAPGAGFGSPAAGMMPMFDQNQVKQEAGQALSKVDPRYFSRKALEQLPPSLQVVAADYLKNGTAFEPPPAATVFDPFKHLPQDLGALEAGQRGLISPETYQAGRIEKGLEVSPSRKAFESFMKEDREDRQVYDAEDREDDQAWRDSDRDIRDRQTRARLGYQDSLSRAREARRVSNEAGLINLRASKSSGADGKVAWDTIVDDSKAAQKDWDTRLKQALQGLTGGERQRERTNFIRQNGDRPRQILPTQARRLARDLNREIESGDLSLDEAENDAIEVTSDIMAGDSYPAARAVRRQRRSAAPLNQMRSEVRDMIRQMNPGWTDSQVEDAANQYLWSQAEGGEE